MKNYNSTKCDTHQEVYNRRHGYTITVNSNNCSRCDFKNQADNLSTRIYEWPLPSDEFTAKATVFELQVPPAFGEWRDASSYMVARVLRYVVKNPVHSKFQYTLAQHHGICQLLSAGYHRRRIVPLSSIKSHIVNHRGHKAGTISYVQDKDVCLNNALRYAYYV